MNQSKNRIVLAVVALLLLMTGFMLGTATLPLSAQQNQNVVSQPILDNLSETERLFTDIYNRVSPSVVSVVNEVASGGGAFTATGSGSGFVLDTLGHIATNFHVVDGADRIVINFFDGTITEARVVGLDPSSDLAVVRVSLPADRLSPSTFADSDQLVVGQTVLAIGNPFSRDWTLTSGIISALNRAIDGLDTYAIGGVIQTDAAINPGNSGGPLLNLRGEVIGVNSQIVAGLRQNAGVGFAIPSNLVRRVTQELIASGQVNYSYIGISRRSIDLDLIRTYNLPDNIRGVAVQQALANRPAALGGVRSITPNSIDIITAINGQTISNFDEMVGYLSIHTRPGETITLTIFRGGQTFNAQVTLATRP